MKYLLKTPYPCLVKTQTETAELDVNDTLECEDEQILFVYPITPDQMPFCVNLSLKMDSPFYSFLNHNGQNILYLEKKKKFDVFQKADYNFSGKNCKILVSENEISFETDHQLLKCHYAYGKKKPQLFKVKNFACVQFQHDFFAYLVPADKLSHFSGDEISFDKNILTVTKKYHDSKCREKVSQYEISDEIKIKKEEVISTNKQDLFDKNLVSYKFLECVKANDFPQIKTYLAPNLSDKIGEEQIRSFFGYISDFLPLSANEFIAISSTSKKYVSFELINGKINDISIDEL